VQTDPATDTNSIAVPLPELDIAKTNVDDVPTAGDVERGRQITYTYSVANTAARRI
jgi:hypothetical protein